ncbi:MAG: patatin family protein [Bacilli bacterium]|nr:patatin family protein [Bacilli bacterium]
MKTCLVLEGGGLRGIYSAGVLDEMFKDKIKVDAIIGVSMGALVGINYKSKQPERAIRYNLRYCDDKRYIGLRSLLKTGNIANKEFAYYKVPNELDKFDYETYKKSKIKMYITATNIETGEAEYIEVKDATDNIEYFRASSSIPGVSRIVEIGDKKYLDGGMADSIPIKKALELGYDRVIVVLTRPIEYRKKDSKMKWLQSRYKKYPKFQKLIATRNKRYNEQVEEILKLEKKNKIFCIRPSRSIKIGRMEKDERTILKQYNLGKEDYLNRKSDLKKYLKKK